MAHVIIGMDPHKLSATIEVLDERERVLGGGRYDTDRNGYRQLLTAGRRWPQRVWAVEGAQGIGRHLTQRLIADGETVVDVPAKLSARTRVFSTGGQGGILGGALCALATDFTRCSLGVPAANYSTLLNRSADFDQFLPVFDNAYPDTVDRQLVFALAQIVWDRGEADGYLQHLIADPLPGTPAKRVLMIEAFGDHQVANIATEVEARTIGARVRQPALAPGRSTHVEPYWDIPAVPSFPFAGSVLVPVDSGTPAPPADNQPNRAGADPHSHPGNSAQIRSMIAQFLVTGQVVDACGTGTPCTAPAS